MFAVYPQRATMAPTNQAAADIFCDCAVKVMQRYSYVKKVIIGNEPNQPKSWQPIWIPAGFGDGTATIVLRAEMNPARTSTLSLKLGGVDASKLKPKKPKTR